MKTVPTLLKSASLCLCFYPCKRCRQGLLHHCNYHSITGLPGVQVPECLEDEKVML